jgi:Protein of unknown function (DUF1592)
VGERDVRQLVAALMKNLPLLVILCACSGNGVPGTNSGADSDGAQASAALVELSPPLLLRRMSLDLRGILPSIDELDAVEADPTQLDIIRDQYLDDPLFEERLVELLAERWHTRLDTFEIQYYDYQMEPDQEFEFERSVGEEPLRLIAHVVAEDLPWTDIVTADYTMANETLAEIWPLDYPKRGTGWQKSTWLDGRPPVGVLASNGLWWRYVTNISNMNRSRVAAMSRLLLCQDMLSRPVSLTGAVALSDEDATAAAIREVPACLACHATIEPLAAALFGFWTVISYNPLELGTYHPERETLGPRYLGFEPAYFGQPIEGLVDLGVAIANDPRFYTCAAEQAAELYWRRPVGLDDFAQIDALRVSFLEQGGTYKNLIRDVMDTAEYRAGAFEDDASEADLDRELTWRMVSPAQMSSTLEDLTGFVWTFDGFEQMANDNPGYRVLAGGVDGYSTTRPQQDPGISWLVTSKRLAQAAAAYASDAELQKGGERKSFSVVTVDDLPGDANFTAELERLHWRLYAVRPDADRIAEAELMWTEMADLAGPTEAWSRLYSAMLRDPEFVAY